MGAEQLPVGGPEPPRAALLQAVGRREAQTRVGGSEIEKKRRGFRQWKKSILQLRYNMGRLSLYMRFTACRKVMLCMVGVMHRMMQHVMGGWAAEVRRQKREELDAASANCSAALGASRPVGAWRCGGASALRASSSASRARWRRSRGCAARWAAGRSTPRPRRSSSTTATTARSTRRRS